MNYKTSFAYGSAGLHHCSPRNCVDTDMTLMKTALNSALNTNRRHLLKLAAAAAFTVPTLARAAWPDRPIRLIVPSAAGGAPDVICRIVANELARLLGQSIVIDNKPGASGNIGMQELARAAPDGYTLGYGNVGTLAINKSLFAKLPYDPDKLVPVALLGYVQNALVVRSDLGVNNIKELIAMAKAKPGKLVMGSPGNGTTGHLGGELFKSMTGTFMIHVPYRGSPQAIQDLMGGQVDVMFDNLSSIAPHIKSGRVKVLGVSGRSRSPLFPDIAAINEVVPGYETSAWGGIVAPPGTPRDIAMRINADINKTLGTPATNEKLVAVSWESTLGPPERLQDRAARETPMWAGVIKRSGARID